MTIRVVDYAVTGTIVRSGMIRDAAAILSNAGVESEWVECRAPRRERYPAACDAPLGELDLVLRILPGRLAQHSGALGATPMDSGPGIYASIYRDAVVAMAAQSGWLPGDLMGHAAAHEIGHILLGTAQHETSGLMQAIWKPATLRSITPPELQFSPAQAAVLCAAVRARAMRD